MEQDLYVQAKTNSDNLRTNIATNPDSLKKSQGFFMIKNMENKIFEKAKIALRKYVLANKEKVKIDLELLREKSK